MVMELTISRSQSWFIGAAFALAVLLQTTTRAGPTNGLLLALGLTNSPIGEATLEIINDGVLHVGNTAGGQGVSVALADGFVPMDGQLALAGNHCRQTVGTEGNGFQCFRLRRHLPSLD